MAASRKWTPTVGHLIDRLHGSIHDMLAHIIADRPDMHAFNQAWHVTQDKGRMMHHVQPSPRTMAGPSRLATGRGRRFHAAMNMRYFGFSGLTSGTPAPGASL